MKDEIMKNCQQASQLLKALPAGRQAKAKSYKLIANSH